MFCITTFEIQYYINYSIKIKLNHYNSTTHQIAKTIFMFIFCFLLYWQKRLLDKNITITININNYCAIIRSDLK